MDSDVKPNFCGHVLFNEMVNGNARISSIVHKAVSLKDFEPFVREIFGIDLLTMRKACDGIWSSASCTPNLWIKVHRASDPCPEGWTDDVHMLSEVDKDG